MTVTTIPVTYPLPADAAVQALRELPTYTEVIVHFTEVAPQHLIARGLRQTGPSEFASHFTSIGGFEVFLTDEGFTNWGDITKVEVVKVYDSDAATISAFAAAVELVEV